MNPALPATRTQRIMRETKDYLIIALGMIMYGIGWTVFLLPSDIPSTAVPGIASIIFLGHGISGAIHLFDYKPCLAFIGVEDSGSEVLPEDNLCRIGADLYSGGHPKVCDRSVDSRPAFHVVCAGRFLLRGRNRNCLFRQRKYGRTDIIAAIVNKYRDISLGRVILMCDLIIISSSYFVLHNWEKVVYGYVVLFISSFVLDQVVNSARQSVQFFIISSKYEEIGARINKDLHRGVTFIDGVGCYTHNGVKMMFVLAKKRESNTIFRLIKDIDPKAFVSQSAVIGVFGEGFDRIKVK